MEEDISKNTLLVLVVLTVVISLLGTWTVINEAGKVRMQGPVHATDTTTGKVSVNVQALPDPVSTTGQVVLNIVNDASAQYS